jgi:hypothetical protein
MPLWFQVILASAALVTALGVLWKKVLKPILRAIHLAEEMLPLLKTLTAEFKDTPHAFKILDQIIGEFRTDSGSSLRDVVDRLESAAQENAAIADGLRVSLETDRRLSERDREDVGQLRMLLDRLSVKIDRGEVARDHSTQILEKIAAVVAVRPLPESKDEIG